MQDLTQDIFKLFIIQIESCWTNMLCVIVKGISHLPGTINEAIVKLSIDARCGKHEDECNGNTFPLKPVVGDRLSSFLTFSLILKILENI